MLKKKYLDARNWTWLEKYTYKFEHIKEDIWEGFVSVVDVETVKEKLIVQHTGKSMCLCDDGYLGVIFLPDKESLENTNWCVSVIYDKQRNVVEWYFDIIKASGLTEEGIPYFDDLYLDLVVAPDFTTRLLDEDELEEALRHHKITEQDYKLAYDTYNYLIHQVVNNEAFMIHFLNQFVKMNVIA